METRRIHEFSREPNESEKTFFRADDSSLIEVIAGARERLVFIAPGVRKDVAEALAKAMELLPSKSFHIVLDVDAEICRLGYGSMAGLTLLQEAVAKRNLILRHHPGIRIGLLIADDTTVIYSPTPLLIETGSIQPDKPNAIILRGEVPFTVADACGLGPEGDAETQVGTDEVDSGAVEAVAQDLRNRPPKKYNIARVERVFSSLLHYVEFKIEDYKLTSRALLLDAELFGVKNEDVIRRLSNRYRLFAAGESLTVEIPAFKDDAKPDAEKPKQKFGPLSVDRERNRLKKKFVIEAGKFGSLILRRNVPDFEKEIAILRAKVEAYKNAVQTELKKRTDEIVQELLAALTQRLQQEPPDRWRTRHLGNTLTVADVKRLFEEDVRGEVDRVSKDFKPEIFTTYKDVTYETFKDPKFVDVLERYFGKDEIARVFKEYDAAPEQQGKDEA
jgi:hypothetical protein